MLVSSYFLIGRRFCRRFFILTGLFIFAVGVYLVIALLHIYVPTSAVTEPRQPLCLRPQLDLQLDDDSKFDSRQPLRCDEDEPDWIDASNGTFRITTAARDRHGDVLCQYVPILRGTDDFQTVKGQPIKPMLDGTSLPSDFFEARCVGSDGAVHVGLYSGIAVDPAQLERCRSRRKNVKDSQLDIMILGFDSVSRTSWLRHLPKSHQFIVNELGAAVFDGYNVLGDGTPPALLPLLTGKTETELPEARRGFFGADTVDEHPWIWHQLKNVDYMTQWAEDSAEIGTVYSMSALLFRLIFVCSFTFRMLGFRRQPVDHYMRTFYLAAERRYSSYRPFCIGSRARHVNMFTWQQQFFDRYSDCLKFSFIFHSEFSHDNSVRLALADDDLLRHLSALLDAGHLNRTVLVLMSDHGPRFDRTRRTARGKYDERLPYLAIRLPPTFAARHPTAAKNLHFNAAAGRLVTTFDIHATLLDVMHFATNERSPTNSNGGRVARAISLFDEVPVDRTCSDADIAAHWCACLRWHPLTVDSSPIQHAAQRVVDAINAMTSSHRSQCAQLRLDDVIGGDLFDDDTRLLQFRRSSDVDGRVPEMTDTLNATEVLYRVAIRTQPGDALFEATVRHPLESADQFDVDSRQISRINEYGRQPYCVMDRYPHLRPYCFCVVQESSSPNDTSAIYSEYIQDIRFQ